jgi:Lon protease-like protein
VTALPPVIPLFPLGNVVLFPGVPVPLHIFEPRYRKLVSDALAGPRVVGMVLLRPGWESDYEGRPPVFEAGCAGVIDQCEELPDGHYNIVLDPLEKQALLDTDGVQARFERLVSILEFRALERTFGTGSAEPN